MEDRLFELLGEIHDDIIAVGRWIRIDALGEEMSETIADERFDRIETKDDEDDEEAWARSFSERPGLLQSMAREALEEHRRGETRPLDELIR
jgi:hypothetical protein